MTELEKDKPSIVDCQIIVGEALKYTQHLEPARTGKIFNAPGAWTTGMESWREMFPNKNQ